MDNGAVVYYLYDNALAKDTQSNIMLGCWNILCSSLWDVGIGVCETDKHVYNIPDIGVPVGWDIIYVVVEVKI